MTTQLSPSHLRLSLTLPSPGTAAVISPVNKVGFKGEDIHIPTGEDGMGPLSRPIWKHLTGIQRGAIPSLWSVEVA